MQAVAAHVRAKHAEFLAENPEAEVLLEEALAACAELQAAQDGALLAAAVSGARTPVPSPGPSGTGRKLQVSASVGTPPAAGSLNPFFPPPIPGSPRAASIAERGESGVLAADAAGGEAVPGASTGSSTGAAARGASLGTEIEAAVEAESGVASAASGEVPAELAAAVKAALVAEEDDPTRLTAEDYEAEMAELRSIASAHAESAAALQELVAKLAGEHSSAVVRADDLEARASWAESQCDALQTECEALTRALVDVKMLYAEKDNECMRLAQRLKRALATEGAARDEVEDLRRRLLVVAPDEVLVEDQDQFRQAMKSAQKVADAELAAVVRASTDGTPSRTSNAGTTAAPPPVAQQPPLTPTLSTRTSGSVEQQQAASAGASAGGAGEGSTHSVGSAGQPPQSVAGDEVATSPVPPPGGLGGKGLGKGKLPPKPKHTASKKQGGSSEIEPAPGHGQDE